MKLSFRRAYKIGSSPNAIHGFAIGTTLLLAGLTLPGMAAARDRIVTIACNAGSQSFDVPITTTVVNWEHETCICEDTAEQAKETARKIISGDMGVPRSQDIGGGMRTMVARIIGSSTFPEGEDTVSKTLYCYKVDDLVDLAQQNAQQ